MHWIFKSESLDVSLPSHWFNFPLPVSEHQTEALLRRSAHTLQPLLIFVWSYVFDNLQMNLTSSSPDPVSLSHTLQWCRATASVIIKASSRSLAPRITYRPASTQVRERDLCIFPGVWPLTSPLHPLQGGNSVCFLKHFFLPLHKTEFFINVYIPIETGSVNTKVVSWSKQTILA